MKKSPSSSPLSPFLLCGKKGEVGEGGVNFSKISKIERQKESEIGVGVVIRSFPGVLFAALVFWTVNRTLVIPVP